MRLLLVVVVYAGRRESQEKLYALFGRMKQLELGRRQVRGGQRLARMLMVVSMTSGSPAP